MAGNVFKADIIPAVPDQAAAAKRNIAGIASLQHAWAQVRAGLQGEANCGPDAARRPCPVEATLVQQQ